MSEQGPEKKLLDAVIERSERPASEAVWGITGSIVGFLVWILATVMLAAGAGVFMTLAGLPLESVSARYAIITLSQLLMIAVALGIPLVLRATPRALGPKAAGWPGLLEALGLGALLVLFVQGYSWLLSVLAPGVYESMLEEVAKQLALLEGPLGLLLFSAVIGAPLSEEIFFRGFMFRGLRSGMPFLAAAFISSLLFAAIHLMWFSILPLFLVGMAAAWIMERRQSLVAAFALHAAYNFFSLLWTLVAEPGAI